MRAKGLLFAWGILSATQAIAQNPGDNPAAGNAQAVPAASAPESSKGGKGRMALDCLDYLSNPYSASFVWNGSKVYFVGQRKAKEASSGNSVLYGVDLSNGRHQRILAFKSSAEISLIGHGRPNMAAISIVSFPPSAAACREGAASALGVKWEREQKKFPTYPPSVYKAIPTDSGTELADLSKNAIEILDVATQQRRILLSFQEELIPLYVRQTPITLIAFNSQTKELQRFEHYKKEASSVLRLKPGMRLVQQGKKFGSVTAKNSGRTLQIAEIKDWSGKDFRVFDLLLPAGWDEKKSRVLVDFEGGTSYVTGSNRAAQKELRSILAFNAQGGKVARSLQAPQGSYFSAAALAPDGKYLVALVAALEDDAVQSLWVDGKGGTQKIDLTKSSEDIEAPAPAPKAAPTAPPSTTSPEGGTTGSEAPATKSL